MFMIYLETLLLHGYGSRRLEKQLKSYYERQKQISYSKLSKRTISRGLSKHENCLRKQILRGNGMRVCAREFL